MKKQYDLLREPWIPVQDQEGKTQYLGIWDTLLRAHELRGIVDGSLLVEYSLHRLLSVFLMDAFRPEEVFDIEDLLDEGKFPEDTLAAYVKKCADEGSTFDLFDEKRPFLQTPYREEWDKEKKSVRYLDCRIPTGNNHVHFDHLNKGEKISFGEAARLLAVCPLFITAGAQGYPSSVNAAPPFFTVIKEGNLFKTLVNLLIPIEEIENFDSIPVYWRADIPVEPKKKVTRTSWLYGMFFPARRVLLLPEEDGIREIYYSQGMNFCEPANWTDPHVTYRYGKDGRFPWRPNGKRAVWRNLYDLVNVQEHHAPKILELYSRREGSGKVQICLYGVETSQASYVDLHYYDLQIPLGLMKEGRARLLQQCIGEAEKLAGNIHGAMQCQGVSQAMGQEAVDLFYQICETALWNLCQEELSQEQPDGEQIMRAWKMHLYEIGQETVKKTVSRLNLTGREWIGFYEKLSGLNRELQKLKKEGVDSNGGQ